MIFKEDRAVTKSRPFFTLLLVFLAGILLGGALLNGCSSGNMTVSTVDVGSTNTATAPITTARAIFQASGDAGTGHQPHAVVLNLEVARTTRERATGLMFRRELVPDQGMVFIWDAPVKEPFWMKNTLIPLSIAYISGDGVVLDLQEMAAQSLDLHNPAAPYSRAVEANQGFFSNNGVRVGDKVTFEGI